MILCASESMMHVLVVGINKSNPADSKKVSKDAIIGESKNVKSKGINRTYVIVKISIGVTYLE